MSELIPRAVLFADPDHGGVTLSPDGRVVGWTAPYEGVPAVWVRDLASGREWPVTGADGRAVRGYTFCHDDHSLLAIRDAEGDENWQVIIIDLSNPERAPLEVTPAGAQAYLLAHQRSHPTEVLIAVNDRDPQLHDLYRIELDTGRKTLLAANPGYIDWLVDADLNVRGGVVMTDDGALRLDIDGVRGALNIPFEDAGTTSIVGFTAEGTLLLVSSLGAEFARLLSFSPSTGEWVVLAEDSAADLTGVWVDPVTRAPQVVETALARQRLTVIDPQLVATIEALRSGIADRVGDVELAVDRRERSGRQWTVTAVCSSGPTWYGMFDALTHELTELCWSHTGLQGLPLVPMEPFVVTARDGLSLHGYLTAPTAKIRPNASLPAVVLVHGGPWAQDSWGYDPEVQWLANRGYLVVQVNFRGSTGRGRSFVNAGDREWGAAMQDDLVDVVRLLASQGVLDPERVAIFGTSYGGYAALMGVIKDPEVYRAAVSVSGISDLRTLIASFPAYWEPLLAQMYRRVGHPERDSALLAQRSPLGQAEKITVPVLLAHGAHDPRVPVAEAEQLAAVLGKDRCQYLLFPDEGHGLIKPENREQFYASAEAFLASQLGGRYEPRP